MWTRLKELFLREPAAFVGLMEAGMGLLIVFELITPAVAGALNIFFGAVVTVFVRALVIPVKKLEQIDKTLPEQVEQL